MQDLDRRLRRERRTIEVMIELFCRGRHGHGPRLCDSCTELRDYARQRLACCPFGAAKPTCLNCTVHCYRPEMRDRVRDVMRFSGPRMLRRHPYLALMHLLVDGRRPAPERHRRGAASNRGTAAQ